MSSRRPPRSARRRPRSAVPAALVAAAAALFGVVAHQVVASSSSSAGPRLDVPYDDAAPAGTGGEGSPPGDGHLDAPPLGDGRGSGGALDREDGLLPEGVSVFDDGFPGVANLDPALRSALRRAAADAAGDGVEMFVNSGWRSPEYQEELLEQAVSEYGSRDEAARWVATPATSAHVSGDAVDVGPADATAWLAEHGADYGLCRVYRNEPWHYELRPRATGDGCPPLYADPTHDPRMQR
jgi:D-alanyl-D-alanine carboxypeptidase